MLGGINTTARVFERMSLELGQRKEIIAIAEDRESAEVAAEAIREEIEFRDHVNSGRLLNSVSVSSAGGGEYNVKAVPYAKYVNGYDREKDGSGFIDDGVNSAILDGYSVEVAV